MDWSEQQAKYGALVQPQQVQTPTAPAKKAGGLTGLIENVARGFARPFNQLLVEPTVSAGKQVAAELTHNKVAEKNANKNLFGGAKNATDAIKNIAGNAAQVGLSAVAPEAGSLVKNVALGAGYGGSSALAQRGSTAEDVINGALKGGATGGVTAVGGKILQKLTGKFGDVVENGASKVASKKAEQEAVQTATKAAEEEAPYAAISKTGRERGNMRSTLDFFKNKLNMGTDPAALRTGAELVTGENGVVSGTMRKLLGDAGDVPTSDVLTRTKEALVKEAGQLGDVETKGSHANGVLRSVRDTLQGTAYKGEGNLSGAGNAAANNVFDTLQNIEGRIHELGDIGADAAEKRALKAAKGALEDSIYKNGNLDKVVSGYKLAPEDVAAIHATAAKIGVSPEAVQHVVDGINNATSGKELRSLQAPFVNASKLANVADRAGEGILTDIPKVSSEGQGFFTGRGGRYNALEAASLLGGNPIMGIPLAANIAASAGDGAAPGIIQKAGEGLVEAGSKANQAIPGGTGNFLSNLITRAGSTQQPSQPEAVSQATPPPVTQQTSDTGAGTDQNQSIFNSDTIQRLVLEDLAKNQGKNVSTLLSLYNAFGKEDKPSAAQQKAITGAKNAQGTLQQIEDSFSAAGGGQGKVGGFLSNLTGKVGANSNVATYNDTATALAASLYKALGNTGTISDKDQQLIAKLIPKTTDTDTTAKAKLAQLENLLQQSQDNLTTQ